MKIIYTDVLVIGGGLAGLRIGDRRQAARPRRDHPVAGAAQALALRGGAGRHAGEPRQRHQGPGRQRGRALRGHRARQRLGRRPATSCACSSTPRPRRCASWPPGACRGAACARATARSIINGQKVTITERDEAHGLLAQRDFGGTKKWRTCYVSDGTGHAMLYAMSDQAIADSIPVHERTEAIALIHDGGRCYGAVVRDLDHRRADRVRRQGDRDRHRRRGTALPRDDQRGDLRRHRPRDRARDRRRRARQHGGGAVPSDRHLSRPASCVTEGCRGDGGLLRDVDGHRFMPDYEPEKKELASRDVVSRRMEEHIAQGQGREVALRRAPLARHHAARASSTSSTTCAR